MPRSAVRRSISILPCSTKQLYDLLIVFRFVGKIAVGAHLDGFSFLFFVFRGSRTMLHAIERAIAEQAVAFRQPLVARKISACPVFKKAIGWLHTIFLLSVVSQSVFSPASIHLPRKYDTKAGFEG